MQRVGDTRHKIVSLSAPGAERLSQRGVHPDLDTLRLRYLFDRATLGRALVDRGAKTWFFITVDNNFGYDLERDTAEVVTAKGGKVSAVPVTRSTAPISPPTCRGRRVEGEGRRPRQCRRRHGRHGHQQAKKLGMIPGPQTFAGCRCGSTIVDALGLDTAQGLMLSRKLLLGSRRGDPRLVEAVFRRLSARCRTACRPASIRR